MASRSPDFARLLASMRANCLDESFHARRLAEPGVAAAWSKAMEDAKHRCKRCGVALPGAMEVGHKDGDHGNDSPENLECLCPFCHRLDHPVASAWDSLIELIWAPDMPQEQVTRFVWAGLAIKSLGGGLGSEAGPDVIETVRLSQDFFLERRRKAAEILGTGRADAFLMEMFRRARLDGGFGLDAMASVMSGVRLAPLPYFLELRFDGADGGSRTVNRLEVVEAALFDKGGSFHGVTWRDLTGVARQLLQERRN